MIHKSVFQFLVQVHDKLHKPREPTQTIDISVNVVVCRRVTIKICQLLINYNHNLHKILKILL